MIQNKRQESIAIIGGGITGIAATLELAKTERFRIFLFEKNHELGGLSSYYQWQNVICDRFYHVVLPTDNRLIEFIRYLNLEPQLYWKKVRSGFYGQGQLVPLSSIAEFARFPFLSFWQKMRMGLGIIYSAQIRKPTKLNKVYAREWLIKIFGSQAYMNVWEPLLHSKLGNARDKIPATFIWMTIKRLYGARSFIRKQEKMGHVRGGYRVILDSVERILANSNVTVFTNAPVLEVSAISQSKKIALSTSSKKYIFDKLLFTIPYPEIIEILDVNPEDPYWRKLRRIEYLSVICVLLILSRKLCPYYVINLLDKNLPFTGIIESTNIIPIQDVAGCHLVYLPRYLTSDDILYDYSEDQIIELFLGKLKMVFPGLDDEYILHKRIFRERYVQPVPKPDSFEAENNFYTPLPNIYVANSSMIYISTLNNNAMIDLAQKAARTILMDFTGSRG